MATQETDIKEYYHFCTAPLEEILGENPMSRLSPELYIMDRNMERLMVKGLQEQIAEYDRLIAESKHSLTEKANTIAEKDRIIAELQAQLAPKQNSN